MPAADQSHDLPLTQHVVHRVVSSWMLPGESVTVSLRDIAHACEASDQATRRALHRLARRGLIRIEPTTGAPNRYTRLA